MLTGPQLDEVVKDTISWFISTRTMLIAMLEEEYPFGSVKMTPEQQIERFLSMTPQEWAQEVQRISIRYQGMPDAEDRTTADVQQFLQYIKENMNRLGVTQGV